MYSRLTGITVSPGDNKAKYKQIGFCDMNFEEVEL